MHMINWPAALQYAGEAELTYLADADAWSDVASQRRHVHAQDRLIDAEGVVYSFDDKQGLPVPTGEHISLVELQEAIRAHAALSGQCCVAKFAAGSFAEAMQALAELDNA